MNQFEIDVYNRVNYKLATLNSRYTEKTAGPFPEAMGVLLGGLGGATGALGGAIQGGINGGIRGGLAGGVVSPFITLAKNSGQGLTSAEMWQKVKDNWLSHVGTGAKWGASLGAGLGGLNGAMAGYNVGAAF